MSETTNQSGEEAKRNGCACGKSEPGQRDADGYQHGAKACQYTDVIRTDTGWSRR